ncbi:MAG: Gfo/Idh/MocA family oxidoreductase [Acidobacteriota bacterium]|nr:MAG: Gfo/Idh/MocA family oxidoreductase [Acidobacteriota bacterium]
MANRRSFLKAAGAGLLSAAGYDRISGANERIRAAFIGIGLIGKRHLLDFLAQPDLEVAAICEVYEPRLREGIATTVETSKSRPDGFRDFRRMLERRDIDAVVVSTPDHWHALMTMLANAAGKDVYVEKPLTLFIREGRWMIDVARHHRRIVQIGTQQRSGEQYRRCLEIVRGGHIGEVRNIRISSFRNIMPGFTQVVGTEPLSPADWRMWLGPAPDRPFEKERGIYHFRWFEDYSGGQTTNLLAHNIDIAQWVMNAMPVSVAAMGRRFSLKGIGETPDVFEAIFEYPEFILNWSQSEICAGVRGGTEFCGTKGVLRIDRSRLEVTPDRMIPADSQIPSFTGPRSAARREYDFRASPVKLEGYEQVRDQFQPHVRNFLDCIKSRQQPVSDLESGHHTAVSCHLANIALKTGRTVRWDHDKEEIIGDPEASALMERPYRAPWDRELRAVLPRK